MKKMLVVINPRSGSGKAASWRERAALLAQRHGWEPEFGEIGPGVDGEDLAHAALKRGCQRVVSIGGDGTLNRLAKVLIGTPVVLGVVPVGSGNGYARSLRLPRDPERALALAMSSKAKQLDVGYLNDRPFLGTAGIGFDARIARDFDQSVGRGLWNYARLVMKSIIGAKPLHTVIEANNKVYEVSALMVVFCNTREFGNGAVISPSSRPDDGVAELRIVRKPALLNLALAMARVYSGRADGSRYIQNLSVTQATVHQADTIAHLDGEPAELGHDIHFRLAPKALWVAT